MFIYLVKPMKSVEFILHGITNAVTDIVTNGTNILYTAYRDKSFFSFILSIVHIRECPRKVTDLNSLCTTNRSDLWLL
jgi:hypothetical protein